MTEPFRTRSPHDPAGYVPPAQLLSWWESANERAFRAKHTGHAVDPADLITALAVGTRLAQAISAPRWVLTAELLRLGAVECWAQIGDALGTTEVDARDGFAAWITQQTALFLRTGCGLTEAEAAHLTELAEGVQL
jgi:hypothetical protein